MDSVYYIVLAVTAISYLLGLFLSFCEKKGKASILSDMGNAGFIHIFGVNTPVPEQMGLEEEKPIMHQDGFTPDGEPKIISSSYMDEEIL